MKANEAVFLLVLCCYSRIFFFFLAYCVAETINWTAGPRAAFAHGELSSGWSLWGAGARASYTANLLMVFFVCFLIV